MALLVGLSSCSSKDEGLGVDPNAPIVLDLPEMSPQPLRFPVQERMSNRPSEVTAQMIGDNSDFGEPMTFLFEKRGVVNTKYRLSKVYLGSVDDYDGPWSSNPDNVTLESSWGQIYFDPKNYYIYGEQDERIIGFVHRQEGLFRLEFLGGYEVLGARQISFLGSDEVIIPRVTTCPTSIGALGESYCQSYIQLFNALTSIDYQAMGQVAPDVARDVVSVSTLGQLLRGAFLFSPDVDSIRVEFLLPILRSISQIRDLTQKPETDSDYLLVTRETYSNLIVTSIDSVIKIQKMAPQALSGMGDIALGSALAYIGVETLGDARISKNQPPWFQEVIAPIIREVGVLMIDLVLNGSNTSFEDRLHRFIDMEAQVTAAVVRLCRSSTTSNFNECTAALN